ncbi:MAG: 2-ketoisovalerate ferredoxin oxidoreductase [Deltaproteobacteria bacterium HGW-Deltaproteobacteria-1]|nr:MAG: 2-ketoisovalerate ferredoxin oxidoreductase [Deltaproteobacteria bacterium HGW-Deltaproteobacteria-1]
MQVKTTILSLPTEEFVHPGTRACTGCGLAIAYRVGLKALGKDTMLVVPPSCLTVLQGLFPVASTALSGAAERGDNFIYFCYDNEGYMNTGAQRSGTTPIGAITANTPFKGKLQQKKDVPAIMAAHKLSYVAACSAAYPLDLFDKIKNCMHLPGTKYFHIHIPCPPGWGYDPRYGIKIGRLAVETGYYDLYEIVNGEFKLTAASEKLVEKRKLVPVQEYFRTQSRFRLLTDAQIADIQQKIDEKWAGYYNKDE